MRNSRKTLLWKVNGHSYVFGTMHVKDQRVFENLPFLKEKINECEVYAGEYDLEVREGNAAFQAEMLLPDGKHLKDYIGAKKYEKLKIILKKAFGIELDKLSRLKPFLIQSYLSETVLAKEQKLSLDEHLYAYAKAQGKQMTGIETYAEQIEIFKKISLDYQIKMLLSIGSNVNKFRKQTLSMPELYTTGDPQQLFKKTKKGAGKLRKMLVYRRNYIMADRIKELSNQHSIFCAIGAGHLGGEKGVLALLKRHDVCIEPVAIKNIF